MRWNSKLLISNLNLAQPEGTNPKPTVKRVDGTLHKLLAAQALSEALEAGPLGQMILLETMVLEEED
jgi:hypothetical protein